MPTKRAIIIGAGPAGLTAAYELLTRTDITPVILEKSGEIGGISRTTNYKGNRMDMGPHRFFSKSDRVMDWWLKMMPLEEGASPDQKISYQNKSRDLKPGSTPTAPGKDPAKVMLVIQRLTRIYFLRKFFAYPIQLSLDTLRTLGLVRTIKILFSFLWVRLFPRKPEKSLEDFIINKFGRQLYLLFFKDYTEKVWGRAPSEISADWGAQRIKGVSLSKAVAQAIKSLGKKKGSDINQKGTETSLIEQFLYPKYGPGSLWEEVARQVHGMGGKIYMNQDVHAIQVNEGAIHSVNTINSQTGQTGAWEGDYFFSTMPVQELIAGMGDSVPTNVQEVAAGLQYRDFINVGILLTKLSDKDGKRLELKDNWIYIQERDVKVGRLMIYNNWGGGMIKDPNTTWIGMEYFCNKTDAFWALSDENIQAAAIRELEKMELARVEDVLDITVRRMEKTYPAYFGTYNHFDQIRSFTDTFENLFLVGRNGMHKYNNADHSILTAMVAVDNISAGVTSKANLWSINTEQEYHEEKIKVESTTTQNTPIKKPVPALEMTSDSFRNYLSKNKLNKKFIWIAAVAILVQFIIFKILYPYAGFISGDSYVYLQSAYNNDNINFYPIGYSKFLRLFSVFSSSDTALVAFQYFSIEASALSFILTLSKLFMPGKVTKWLIFSLVVFNPAFLYLSNYVSSDALFLSLSLVWFTLLLWILKHPTINLLIWQVVILFLAFMFRYNALYYPLIATIALLSSRFTFKVKLLAIGSSLTVIGAFVLYTSFQYQKLTGIRQFTPFSGWQIANNAMYAYRYVASTNIKTSPLRFEHLDKMVRHYFDTTRDLKTHPYEMIQASTMYMWSKRSPLQQFMRQQFRKDSSTYLIQWASMAPIYSEYGLYLICQYPKNYFKYYIWPNTLKYYTPPGEFLDYYNMGRDTVEKIAEKWFGYKTKKVSNLFNNFNVGIMKFVSILAGMMNIVFLISLTFVILLKGVHRDSLLSSSLTLGFSLWITNFGFSVFASPITLRYQLFAILVFSSYAFILIDIIYKHAYSRKIENNL